MLIDTGGEIVLSAHGRTFRPDDRMPEGMLAREVPGLESHPLYGQFTESDRRNSPGQQYRRYRLVTVGVRVPDDLKRQLRNGAREAGMTLCGYVAKLLSEAVGYSNPHWRPK